MSGTPEYNIWKKIQARCTKITDPAFDRYGGRGIKCLWETFEEFYRDFAHYDKLQLVSISVDPDIDSLARLREYAAAHGVSDNRWVFVRGEMADVRRLCSDGFKVSDDLPGMHATKFILVDAAGKIRGYYDYDDQSALDRLRRDLATVAGEME
jgi:protein SCO1/2